MSATEAPRRIGGMSGTIEAGLSSSQEPPPAHELTGSHSLPAGKHPSCARWSRPTNRGQLTVPQSGRAASPNKCIAPLEQ